jgi:hypothetical protein
MSRAVFALALLFSPLLLAALPLAAQPSAPHCQSAREQDPDTGAIVQKTHLAPSAAGSTDPLFVWTSDDPDSLMFAVVRNGDALRYAGCFDMTLQADGQPIPLTRLRHDKDPNSSRGTVVEYVRAEIPWADAQKLAAAKSITYTVCKDQLKVDEGLVCEARHVVEVAARWRREQAGKR